MAPSPLLPNPRAARTSASATPTSERSYSSSWCPCAAPVGIKLAPAVLVAGPPPAGRPHALSRCHCDLRAESTSTAADGHVSGQQTMHGHKDMGITRPPGGSLPDYIWNDGAPLIHACEATPLRNGPPRSPRKTHGGAHLQLRSRPPNRVLGVDQVLQAEPLDWSRRCSCRFPLRTRACSRCPFK